MYMDVVLIIYLKINYIAWLPVLKLLLVSLLSVIVIIKFNT